MSSLYSAIRILKCLTPETPVLRVSDVSERLDLPKSTVSRLMKTLSEGGILERNDTTRQYMAGPMALQMGGLYLAMMDLPNMVEDAVRGLVEEFQFTGYVAVLDGAEAVVLRCHQGTYPLKFVIEVGTRQPAAEAALGIGLLAQLEDETLGKVLDRVPVDNILPHPSLKQTHLQIEQFRKNGWAEVPCLAVPGITAIGSAVVASDRHLPAIGFSISFPDIAADRVLRDKIATRVLETAQSLTERTASTSPLRKSMLQHDRH